MFDQLSGDDQEVVEAFLSLFGIDVTYIVGHSARQPAVMQLAEGKFTVFVEDSEVGDVENLSGAMLLWCVTFSVFAQPVPRDARKPVVVFLQMFVFDINEGVVPALCWRVAKTLAIEARVPREM